MLHNYKRLVCYIKITLAAYNPKNLLGNISRKKYCNTFLQMFTKNKKINKKNWHKTR